MARIHKRWEANMVIRTYKMKTYSLCFIITISHLGGNVGMQEVAGFPFGCTTED